MGLSRVLDANEEGAAALKRIVAALLGLTLGVNAAIMLVAGRWWYGVVPGVTGTGPFNPHFVMDIGAAYLVAACGLLWAAARPAAARGAVIASASFLGLHALIHLADAVMGGHPGADLARDFAGVFVPALLAAWVAWPASRQA